MYPASASLVAAFIPATPRTRPELRRRLSVARFGCLLGILAASASLRAEVKVGDVFPPLSSTVLVGGSLPATAGQVVLVDFWASWCAPCKASFPAYGRIYADYAAKGVVIVAVSVDESATDYAHFIRKLKPVFVTVRDANQQLVRAVNVPTMPTSYLLGRDGKVEFVHIGFHGAETERTIRTEIDQLLAERGRP